MRRTLAFAVFLSFSLSAFAAQPQAPAPPSDRPQAQELTPQMLGEMLRAATTFHELVTQLDLRKSLGPDQRVLGPDGRYHHPLQRTVVAIGAGAGAGAAIGGMTHSTNGVFIGAIIGSAGGLIADQIMRHREQMRERALYNLAPEPFRGPRELQHRYRDSPPRHEPVQ
ncbi:MAG: hypothetical protein EHM65_05735 [Acidobacteriales bacterium]|nr:MAG: hypothetical protein EHM65_05735 [Terriglobales bacterium]